MGGFGTAEFAALLGAAGATLLLLAAGRALLLGGLALLAAAEATFAAILLPEPQTSWLGLVPAGLALLGAAAAVFVQRPELVTPVVLAVAPFRFPFEFDSQNAFFIAVSEQADLGRLMPLYAALGGAGIALAWRVGRGAPVARLPRPLALPAAAFIAFASVSLLWSDDLDAAVNLLAFFLLPFTGLLACVGRSPFPAWMPRLLAIVAICLASLFALVGLVEAATGRLVFGSRAVEVGNTFKPFFRVTSLFRDPSLYGRHLVLALVVVVTALLLRRLGARLGAALVILLGAGLFFSYSQSSMAALFVAVAALALATSPRALQVRLAMAVLVLLALSGVAVAAAVQDETTRKATSGRSVLVEDSLRVIADRPLAGAGIGGQPIASRRLADRRGNVDGFVSHTTPLTVGAELGAIGLLLYAALLTGAAWTIDRVRRGHRPLGLVLAAALLALFVHALAYGGFFEDPLTWIILAVASSFLAAGWPEPGQAGRPHRVA